VRWQCASAASRQCASAASRQCASAASRQCATSPSAAVETQILPKMTPDEWFSLNLLPRQIYQLRKCAGRLSVSFSHIFKDKGKLFI